MIHLKRLLVGALGLISVIIIFSIVGCLLSYPFVYKSIPLYLRVMIGIGTSMTLLTGYVCGVEILGEDCEKQT